MNAEVVCEVCGVVVERNKYERHIKYGHKEKRENKCHLCQKSFTSLYNLQYHMAHHMNARNFLCNECPRAYNTAADLAQHQRIHEKQREPYKCEFCEMLFQIRSKYNTHMRIHQTATTKGPRECPICNKKFVCLSSHNRIVHLGMRSYECSDCGKTFGKKSGLDRHTLTVHQKIKAFKCNVENCLSAFGEKSQLTKHMKIHVEKDQSYCSFCKQHFDDIKGHFETVHVDLTHSCDICFKRFSKQVSLSIHTKVFHTLEKNFFCDLCPNKGFAERSQLKRHLRRHQELVEDDVDNEFYASASDSEKSCCSIKMEPEQIFVNDLPEARVSCDIQQESGLSEDVLVEIKEEIVSEDESSQNVKCELDEMIKTETEAGSVRLISSTNIEQLLSVTLDVQEIKEEEAVKTESPKTAKKTQKCKECDIHFDDRNLFQNHFITVHFIHKCVVCNDEFKSKNALVRHAEDHKLDESEMETLHDEPHRTDLGLNCDHCDKSFTKPDHLKAHFMAAHTDTKFDCDKCGRSFTYKSALDRHVKVVHENKRDHKCRKCEKTFGTKYDLSTHFEANHNESTKAQSRRTCLICGKIFSKERNLQIHILAIHNEIKSFECELCGKKFSFKSAKERHLKVVHYNQRSHQCTHCQKFFGTKYDLRNHIAYNHSLNPEESGKYYCSTCEKSFTSSSALKRHHKGVHENIKQKGPRDYRCKFCKEIFGNKYQKEKHLAQVHQDGLKTTRTCRLCNAEYQLHEDFKKHIETHLNAHICVICGIGNADEEALNAHMEEHKHIEMDLRRFICDTCGHRLFNKIQLKVHMRKHMKETNFYVCDICGQSYRFIAPFLYHKKVHEGKKDFVCSHCGKEFMRKQDLTVHIRHHTQEKPFKCTVCDKKFAARQILQMHLQTHSATRKIYNCEECNLTFIDKNQSKMHDESHHPDRRPFWCNLCKKSFKLEHLLKIHKKHKHKPEKTYELEASLETSLQSNDFLFNLWNH